MPIIDAIFLLVLLVSMLMGAWRGFVFESFTLLSWLAAFVLALWLTPWVLQYLSLSWPPKIAYGVIFIVLFLICIFLLGTFATQMRKLVGKIGLSVIDRGLGLIFGFLRGIVILLIVTEIISLTPFQKQAWWQTGIGPQLSAQTLSEVKPLITSVGLSIST